MVKTVSNEEAQALLDSPYHVFVDLRYIHEKKCSGKILDVFSCPRGMLEFWIDPNSPYHKKIFNKDEAFPFYCASAGRSALSAQIAIEMGLAPVAHIAGGFSALLKADAPIEQWE